MLGRVNFQSFNLEEKCIVTSCTKFNNHILDPSPDTNAFRLIGDQTSESVVVLTLVLLVSFSSSK